MTTKSVLGNLDTNTQKNGIRLGAIASVIMAVGVLLGAFGSHSLKKNRQWLSNWHLADRYFVFVCSRYGDFGGGRVLFYWHIQTPRLSFYARHWAVLWQFVRTCFECTKVFGYYHTDWWCVLCGRLAMACNGVVSKSQISWHWFCKIFKTLIFLKKFKFKTPKISRLNLLFTLWWWADTHCFTVFSNCSSGNLHTFFF